jgi:isopentenyl diphosphate isomerase/L-lactate dehydrogenase-like FMN-dependent dehydrogenase
MWQVMRACVRGCQDEESIRANREGFTRFALRPRVLVDVSK